MFYGYGSDTPAERPRHADGRVTLWSGNQCLAWDPAYECYRTLPTEQVHIVNLRTRQPVPERTYLPDEFGQLCDAKAVLGSYDGRARWERGRYRVEAIVEEKPAFAGDYKGGKKVK